jgi:siroheme synthase
VRVETPLKRGSLTVVGTGYVAGGHATLETLACLKHAEKLFYVVSEEAMRVWLDSLNRTAESLEDSYAPGKPRYESYEEMIRRILQEVRAGREVVAAFYGHPGVFVYPSHEAIRRARREGYFAQMLPGISAEDCLIADLGIDPAEHGCQSFEATDFLIHRRNFDPRSHLVLWQAGAIGVKDYRNREVWSREGVKVLAEVLRKTYPARHRVVIYEASQYPVCKPRIERVALGRLGRSRVTVISTLYVAPREKARVDKKMLARLKLA